MSEPDAHWSFKGAARDIDVERILREAETEGLQLVAIQRGSFPATLFVTQEFWARIIDAELDLLTSDATYAGYRMVLRGSSKITAEELVEAVRKAPKKARTTVRGWR